MQGLAGLEKTNSAQPLKRKKINWGGLWATKANENLELGERLIPRHSLVWMNERGDIKSYQLDKNSSWEKNPRVYNSPTKV